MPEPEPTRRFHFRFSLRQLFLLVTLVGIGLWVWNWIFRKEALVQAATSEDQFADNDPLFTSRRTAAFVTGCFTKSTSLSVSLHMVHAGKSVELPSDVFSRKERKDTKGPLRKNVRLWLSFLETITSAGKAILLMSSWNENGEGDERQTEVVAVKFDINVVAKKTLPGKITPGRPYIVYVEGDRAIVVDGSMTVEQFAKINPGNYLVVTVEVK